ncbi:MAG: hypothetical protein C4325_10340 [Blastocatellia bacterium]
MDFGNDYHAWGAVYPKEGVEILHMRLFEDGRFEYDDFPDYDLPRTRNVVITRKEPHLAKADVEKLVALAETTISLQRTRGMKACDRMATHGLQPLASDMGALKSP